MVKAIFQEEQKEQLPKVTSPEVKWFWLEMTSPEAALTGNDVSHVRRMRNRFPRFFLTIVVVQNWASPICLPDVMSRDPEGVSIERVCACATASCSISALLGPFNRKWRHQMSPVGLPLELEVTWPDVLLGVVSRTSGSYNLIIF